MPDKLRWILGLWRITSEYSSDAASRGRLGSAWTMLSIANSVGYPAELSDGQWAAAYRQLGAWIVHIVPQSIEPKLLEEVMTQWFRVKTEFILVHVCIRVSFLVIPSSSFEFDVQTEKLLKNANENAKN